MDLPTSFSASVVILERGEGWLLLIQSAAQGPQKRHKPADNGGIRVEEFFCFAGEWLNSHSHHSHQSVCFRNGNVALPSSLTKKIQLPMYLTSGRGH